MIADFPLDRINEPAPHSDATAWRLLEHLRIWQRDILEYVRTPGYVSPKWPDEYWPPAGDLGDAERWRRSEDAFRADLAALQQLVRDPARDLAAPLSHAPVSILREIVLIAGHTAFHLGEFAALREAMET